VLPSAVPIRSLTLFLTSTHAFLSVSIIW
jgi:hypothetical protein